MSAITNIRVRSDATFVGHQSGQDVHITPDYMPLAYAQLLDDLLNRFLIPGQWEDPVYESPPASITQLATELLAECTDLQLVGAPLPITPDQLKELVTWSISSRRISLRGEIPPDPPHWVQDIGTASLLPTT